MVLLNKKKNKPTVYFPVELEKEKYTGKIYGYYVDDTNHYNVISLKGNDVYKNIIEIGEVFNTNPTESLNKLSGYFENGKIQFTDTHGERCKLEPYSLKLDVFSRNTGILESDIMLKTGAMFVGCGSVGSLAALELAKAGVGRFLLIDNDIIGYHNVCRHQCGILDVGKRKTEAVKQRILEINPYAEVITQNKINKMSRQKY